MAVTVTDRYKVPTGPRTQEVIFFTVDTGDTGGTLSTRVSSPTSVWIRATAQAGQGAITASSFNNTATVSGQVVTVSGLTADASYRVEVEGY